MKDINDLRASRATAAAAMASAADTIETLEGAEAPDQDALASAQTAFETAQADFGKADAAVKRAEAVEAAQASAAKGGDEQAGNGFTGGAAPVPAQPKNPADKAIEVGFIIGALANQKGDREAAAAQLVEAGHSGVAAVLSGATAGAGGVTIPQPLAEQVIDLLRPKVVVRNAGAETSPIPAGKMRHARMATGSTANYGTEATAITESEPTFDNVDQAFKKLTAMVPLSNDLLRMSSVAMARVARNDVVRQMAAREDIAFLRNDGTSGTPKGLRHWALAANWLTEAAKTAAVVEALINKLVDKVEDADISMMAPGWAMRASTKNFIAGLRDANGYPLYPSIDKDGTLKGYKIHTSSQIPNNLGAGSDTEITFCDFSEIMIGDSLNLTIATSDQAAFVNTSGDTVSAFQNDLTLMRAISEHDLAPMHDEAISGATVTGWSL
ncbi:phage major capsid protein, HK97 family [Thalassovita gelatinovora]|uniref:Phage major capsid protein, HK97 family n=1 Tax=Thalassovita gelatinovora TaxID=53501 RepID=A0A0P1FMB1_THAGE|nr:phage major capsid protein [Thalassovita gelatinovora]QIZ79069.1 phage major capsid protein [Thalassovita gelatinovora]CUH68680.1 phage major capsid protein, HK97 family [Thalassovita gelatinovora]SEQ56622.1 phage major capsid protein, HK97 family [Thalassovita gelatinovora]